MPRQCPAHRVAAGWPRRAHRVVLRVRVAINSTSAVFAADQTCAARMRGARSYTKLNCFTIIPRRSLTRAQGGQLDALVKANPGSRLDVVADYTRNVGASDMSEASEHHSITDDTHENVTGYDLSSRGGSDSGKAAVPPRSRRRSLAEAIATVAPSRSALNARGPAHPPMHRASHPLLGAG